MLASTSVAEPNTWIIGESEELPSEVATDYIAETCLATAPSFLELRDVLISSGFESVERGKYWNDQNSIAVALMEWDGVCSCEVQFLPTREPVSEYASSVVAELLIRNSDKRPVSSETRPDIAWLSVDGSELTLVASHDERIPMVRVGVSVRHSCEGLEYKVI